MDKHIILEENVWYTSFATIPPVKESHSHTHGPKAGPEVVQLCRYWLNYWCLLQGSIGPTEFEQLIIIYLDSKVDTGSTTFFSFASINMGCPPTHRMLNAEKIVYIREQIYRDLTNALHSQNFICKEYYTYSTQSNAKYRQQNSIRI